MATPLCPDCKKQMTVRYVCTHCGYDTQRLQTASNRKAMVLPYNCVRCGKSTAKKIGDIAVCGDCFTEGWGRVPEMSLSPISGTTQKEVISPEVHKCPKCRFTFKTKQRLDKHISKIHGGK